MKQIIYLLLLSVMFLSSCKGLISSPPVISNPKETAKLKEISYKQFGSDKEVNNLSVYADEMDDKLESAIISFVENGKMMEQVYLSTLGNKQAPAKETLIQSEFLLKQRTNNSPVKIKDLQFENIAPKFQQALQLLPKEYKENAVLNSWSFNSGKEGKVTCNFNIHAKKDGETSSLQGKRIVTNYYDFSFAVDENGTVTMKE